MCVAGRVSTWRDKNNSRCFIWCFCLVLSSDLSVPLVLALLRCSSSRAAGDGKKKRENWINWTIKSPSEEEIESDKWWWRNDWFSTQLIIQLVTIKTTQKMSEIGVWFHLACFPFFYSKRHQKLLLLFHPKQQQKAAAKPQKTLMCGTAPRTFFPNSFIFFMKFIFKK